MKLSSRVFTSVMARKTSQERTVGITLMMPPLPYYQLEHKQRHRNTLVGMALSLHDHVVFGLGCGLSLGVFFNVRSQSARFLSHSGALNSLYSFNFSSGMSSDSVNWNICFHNVFACCLVCSHVPYEESPSELGNQIDTTASFMLCIHGENEIMD